MRINALINRCCLIILLAVLTLKVNANPVDLATARVVGAKFLSANTLLKTDNPADLQLVSTYRTANNDAAFYVFNTTNGFVIVSADDCAYPILGYSDEGSLRIDDVPVQMEEYLQGFVEQIQYGIENHLDADDEIAAQWQMVQDDGMLGNARTENVVNPLVTANWGQGCYYNSLCPADPTGTNLCNHTLVGCAAVAMGQIMRYWGYPTVGNGLHTYTPTGYPQQTANFGATTYQWNNMPNSLNASSSTAQVNAVATLLWHCGVSLDMEYGTSGSSAYAEDVPFALTNYFLYSSDINIQYMENYSTTVWVSMLKADLDQSRPVYYRAVDAGGTGGHAFVCDGYNSSNQFHFNWGWNGLANGYFAIGALNITTTQTPYYYNNNNAAIFNIHPIVPSYQVIISPNPSNGGSVSFGNKGDRETTTYNFDDGSMMGWITLDADGDGQSWMLGSTVMGNGYGHNTSSDMVLSKSYDNNIGALNPDNYLVSPAKAQYSSISFYACAQDNSWAAEHFGVAVSTTTPTASAFTTIQEWTMTAKDKGVSAPGRGGERTQGNWYQYTVNLSAYAGQPIWVAIRHFYCSDLFYLDVDDITLTTNSGGSNSSSAYYDQGQTCTVTATPNSGYYFANWTENGTVVSSSANYTFTVNDARVLVANFTTQPLPQEYTVTISANPANGGSVAFGSKDERETITCDFENGIPAGWTVIDANNDGYTWCLTSAIPSTWTYYATATLDWYRSGTNAICSGSFINGVGALTPDEFLVTNQLSIANGSSFTFWAAAADASYPADHFGVFVSDNGTSNWTSVQEWTLTAKSGEFNGGRTSRDSNGAKLGTWHQYSVDLSAYAGQQKYIAIRHFNCNDQYIMCVDDITIANVGGSGTPNSAVYTEGQSCTVTATPNTGYAFANWTENGTPVSNNANYTFTVNGNRTLVANFTVQPQTYTVSVSANPSNGGTVTGGGTYTQGQSCTVSATPNSGYTFSNWTENGTSVSSNASYTFTVNGNRTLVAHFTVQPQTYTVSVSANPSNGGTVTGGGAYTQGQSCTVSATPNSGYTFSNWTENGTSVSNNANYTFTVNSNRTLVANFNQIPSYTISVTADPTNGGTVSGGGTYLQGATCALTASPNTGYIFNNWTKNGAVVSTNPSFVFTVTENATYVAHFIVQTNSYTITASADPVEGGVVTGGGNYVQGSVCTLTATPNTGYVFVNWTKNGTVVSTNNSFSFNVSENASYVAHFSILTYTVSVSVDPLEGGVVTGGGTYNYGSSVTVTVIPNPQYTFLNWTENGSVVSQSLSYSFTATSDRQLVAHLSFVSGVEEAEAQTVLAYPNPAHDKLFVECDQHIISCELYDAVGTWMGRVEVDAMKTEIPLNNLSSGMYLVKVITENQIKIVKFIKE